MDVLSHHPVNVTSFGNRVFTVVVSPVSQCGVAFCDVLHEEVHLAVDTQSEEGLGRQRRTPEPCVHKPNTAEARPPEAGGGRGGGGRSRTSAALQQLDSRPAGSGGWRIQLCGWSRPVCGVALRSLSRRGVSSSESLNPVTERWLLLLSLPLSPCPALLSRSFWGPFGSRSRVRRRVPVAGRETGRRFSPWQVCRSFSPRGLQLNVRSSSKPRPALPLAAVSSLMRRKGPQVTWEL